MKLREAEQLAKAVLVADAAEASHLDLTGLAFTHYPLVSPWLAH